MKILILLGVGVARTRSGSILNVIRSYSNGCSLLSCWYKCVAFEKFEKDINEKLKGVENFITKIKKYLVFDVKTDCMLIVTFSRNLIGMINTVSDQSCMKLISCHSANIFCISYIKFFNRHEFYPPCICDGLCCSTWTSM